MATTGLFKYNPIKAIFSSSDSSKAIETRHLESVVAFYQNGNFAGGIKLLQEMSTTGEKFQGIFLAIATCYARMGNFNEALNLVDKELALPAPHPHTRQLHNDILAWVKKPAAANQLTIFTVPKPFKGHDGMIQRNAILSWLKLEPRPEIILMGDEEGMVEVAREFGLIHEPAVARNDHGTPLISSLFERAQQLATNDILAYVNTDIIVTRNFSAAIGAVSNLCSFLVVGRRWDIDIWQSIDFDDAEWDTRLADNARKTALLHGTTGIDYFIFRKGLYREVPPFAVGRTAWDNWLIWEAKRQGAQLIDATHAIQAFHQEHSYTHAKGGVNEVWRGAEANRNRELAAGHVMTVAHADFCIEGNRVIPIHDGYRCPEPTRQDYIDMKFRQSLAAYLNDEPGHALDLLSYIELDTSNCTLPVNYQLHKAKILQALGKKDDALAFIHGAKPSPSVVQTVGHPPVFMQIHTFYPAYLARFYQQHAGCSQLTFGEQINELVRDGFSGSHMIAPYMNENGYESHLVIANCIPAQNAWLRQQGVSITKQDNWLHEIAARQVNSIKPDILYLSDPISFDSRFVRSLTWKPKLILGWRAAVIPEGTDWSEFDVILSGLAALREFAIKLGARHTERFFPGYPSWANIAAGPVDPTYDVVFSGQWSSGLHGKRNAYLRTIVEASECRGFTTGLYLAALGEQLPPEISRYNLGDRFGLEMHRALMSGRIVFDSRATHMARDPRTGTIFDLCGNETANMRIVEATGCGRMLLTEHFSNLADYFEVGREIETFTSEQELLEKIHYYLAHPLEREEIARRGQERCLSDYSMEKKAREFHAIIRKYLGESACMATSRVAAIALKQQAESAMAQNSIQDAFQLLYKAKSLKEPCENLDLLRSDCFLKMQMPDAAVQALLEELRYFPANTQARERLAQLQSHQGYHSQGIIDDDEFQMILAKVRPFTMLGEARLYNLYRLARFVCERNVPGNFVECGVAAGGSSALLAYVIKTYSTIPRTLFSFDSFEGMPEPSKEDSVRGIDAESTGWGTGTCAAPETSVLSAAAHLGVISIVKPVKGYFEETLPAMRYYIGQVAFMHMDADWYASIKTILENLYGNLSPDALVQLDDYGYWEGCSKALHEFEADKGIRFTINQIDGNAIWFQKP